MKITVRSGVFETNSSSMHALAVLSANDMKDEAPIVTEDELQDLLNELSSPEYNIEVNKNNMDEWGILSFTDIYNFLFKTGDYPECIQGVSITRDRTGNDLDETTIDAELYFG